MPNVNPAVDGQRYVAWGWVAFVAFLYMIGMATRRIRNFAYQFFYVSLAIPHELTLDPTCRHLVHHRRLSRHPPTSTTRLDLGWIHPSLARPYSPDLPNSTLPRYSQSSSRRQADRYGPSFERGHDASQRTDSTGLETSAAYIPSRFQGKYRWTPIHRLQYIQTT